MIGHLYTLLFIGSGTVDPPTTETGTIGGGWGWNPPKPKRIDFSQFLDKPKEAPKKPEKPKKQEPKLTPAGEAWLDDIKAQLRATKAAQELLRSKLNAELLRTEQARIQALIELEIAKEAVFRQQMRDFDIVFVAVALAET